MGLGVHVDAVTAPPTPTGPRPVRFDPDGAAGPALGPAVGPPHVRLAVLATLDRWAPTYLAEAQRNCPDFALPPFNDWVNEPLISPETVAEAPRYVVAVPQTIGTPERRGDGSYRAVWDVQVALWLWGGDYQETQDRLGHYTVALRQLLVQQRSLGGFAQGVEWRAERYMEAASTTFRTWGQSVIAFAVTVDHAMNAYAGPAVPDNDPTRIPRTGWPARSAAVSVRSADPPRPAEPRPGRPPTP